MECVSFDRRILVTESKGTVTYFGEVAGKTLLEHREQERENCRLQG